jgi:hypothetical protein
MIMRSFAAAIPVGAASICGVSMPAPARAQPEGSYLQTCRDAYVDGRTLRAECQTLYGRWQDVRF